MRAKNFPFPFLKFSVVVIYGLLLTKSAVAADEQPATIDELTDIFGRAISIVATAGGFLSFIALIAGGFRYITARGDPKAIAGAQGMITWAIVGLAMIIIAWLILKFIFDFTGVDVTRFCIGSGC